MDDQARSRVMRAVKHKNTGPELAVRRLVHAMGYRFRLHRRGLPGTPDIALPRHRVAIFVHGCFWHAHAGCPNGRAPRSRTEYWGPKLARNVERDAEKIAALAALGWSAIVLWECELKRPDVLRARLAAELPPHGLHVASASGGPLTPSPGSPPPPVPR